MTPAPVWVTGAQARAGPPGRAVSEKWPSWLGGALRGGSVRRNTRARSSEETQGPSCSSRTHQTRTQAPRVSTPSARVEGLGWLSASGADCTVCKQVEGEQHASAGRGHNTPRASLSPRDGHLTPCLGRGTQDLARARGAERSGYTAHGDAGGPFPKSCAHQRKKRRACESILPAPAIAPLYSSVQRKKKKDQKKERGL